MSFFKEVLDGVISRFNIYGVEIDDNISEQKDLQAGKD